MMKSVLLSIQPKYCELIANGKKTIEVRKTRPKLETPFKCYIYCTKKFYKKGDGYFQGKYCGKVIGEFACESINRIRIVDNYMVDFVDCTRSCLTVREILNYSSGKPLFGWDISNLKIYDKPKELSEFKIFCKDYYDGNYCDDCKYFIDGRGYEYDESDCGCDGRKPLERPPQSWCYVEELE